MLSVSINFLLRWLTTTTFVLSTSNSVPLPSKYSTPTLLILVPPPQKNFENCLKMDRAWVVIFEYITNVFNKSYRDRFPEGFDDDCYKVLNVDRSPPISKLQ
jgi:hypothetical protein